ncbi:MAG: hypothetical protein Q9195_000798 [Heterodermia aff. obscurata]
MASKLTELEAGELQRQGQDLYRQKKFQAALQRFNAVLQQDRKPALGALDSRAATHAKLGDLQAALRDARRMIQEYKTSCSGYLRTGQILQLLGKEDVASGIYTYGLRNVSGSDPNREVALSVLASQQLLTSRKLIQGMYDKLVQRRSPSTAMDPLAILPVEITEVIFRTCLRVSQSWRSYVCSLPNLWSHLDFSTGTKAISLSTVMAYIKHSRGKATHASTQGLTTQDSVLKCIATLEAAPALGNLKCLAVATDISLDAISQILSACLSLEKAQFLSVTTKYTVKWKGNFPNILSLSINSKRVNTDNRSFLLKLGSLIPRIANVESLVLQNWSGPGYPYSHPPLDLSTLRQLQHLDLTAFDTVSFPKLPSSIRTLVVSDWHSCAFNSPASQAHMGEANLQRLTSLSIGCSFLLADLLKLLEPNKGRITTLNIFNSTDLQYNDLIQLIDSGYLTDIVDLTLRALPVDDHIAELLASQSCALQSLNLAHTKITGVGVKSLLLKEGCQLKQLNLKGCHSVSIDAVEWARGQGVSVIFTFPENELRKSKRVRIHDCHTLGQSTPVTVNIKHLIIDTQKLVWQPLESHKHPRKVVINGKVFTKTIGLPPGECQEVAGRENYGKERPRKKFAVPLDTLQVPITPNTLPSSKPLSPLPSSTNNSPKPLSSLSPTMSAVEASRNVNVMDVIVKAANDHDQPEDYLADLSHQISKHIRKAQYDKLEAQFSHQIIDMRRVMEERNKEMALILKENLVGLRNELKQMFDLSHQEHNRRLDTAVLKIKEYITPGKQD